MRKSFRKLSLHFAKEKQSGLSVAFPPLRAVALAATCNACIGSCKRARAMITTSSVSVPPYLFRRSVLKRKHVYDQAATIRVFEDV